jgi:hypothetical protein
MPRLVGRKTGPAAGVKLQMPRAYDRVITLDEPADVLQHTSPDTFATLTSNVREIYCMYYRNIARKPDYGLKPMPRWDGGETADGRRCKSVWPQVATTIVRCGADPLNFIHAQFTGVIGGKVPRPNQLHNEAAVMRWENQKETEKEQTKNRIASDLNQISLRMMPLVTNLRWDKAKALNYVLRDQNCAISPLVRYCAAVKASLPIAEQLREHALCQYFVLAATYDQVLGNHIPQELRTEGWNLRNQISA